MARHSALAPAKLTLAGLTLALAGACTPVADPPPSIPGSSVIRPTRSIHLRAAFDSDPSAYVGRFVPDKIDTEAIDETAAAQTRCSEFIGYKVVDANQEMDEVLDASQSAAASIGVKGILGAHASAGSHAAARVKYTLKKRMQAIVKDPAALAQCCQAEKSACAVKIIGEFLMGSGEVYEAAGSEKEAGASNVVKSVTGTIDYKDNVAWRRVNNFNDTYFAFLTTPVQLAAAPAPDASCSWCENIPTSLDGSFFCGVSPDAPSESMARDFAMRNAREQVVKFLGELLTTASKTEASLIQGYLADNQVTTAAAQGVASEVKDRTWCAPAESSTPDGKRYKSKVLAFFPKSAQNAAAKTTLEAILAAPRAKTMSKEDRAKLEEQLKALK